MRRRSTIVVAVAGVLCSALLAGVLQSRAAQAATIGVAPSDWRWSLPPGVVPPPVPADNPMSRAKFELGRRLFYDRQLSGNSVLACAGCHLQAKGFADNLPRAVGATGDIHPRAAMMLVNVGYARTLTWANPNETRLEVQARTPMFGEHPVEMGLAGKEPQLLARLAADSTYRALFRASFPRVANPVSLTTVTQALATFERGLTSFDAPYDRLTLRGDRTAMTMSAQRGASLFRSPRLGCTNCHTGLLFDGTSANDGRVQTIDAFHNTGLYNIGASHSYPRENLGRAEFTGREEDNGRFRVPTLRNVAVTAPYMHDGSIATLSDVVDHYARGGRMVTSGTRAGDGALNPRKSRFITGFSITAAERDDLLAFLHALTDSTVLRDPRFADPATIRR
jgi:cytochrome c peroxidase